MEKIKKFGLMALAAVMCLGVVACNDEDKDNGGNKEDATFVNIDATWVITPEADMMEVFDTTPTVTGETNKVGNLSINWNDSKCVVEAKSIECPAALVLNIQRILKSDFTPEEGKSYTMKFSVAGTIKKHFSDGTSTEKSISLSVMGGAVRNDKMQEYLNKYAGLAIPLNYTFGEEGDLAD